MSNASLADLRIRELLGLSAATASARERAPRALTLALAAACASKAVSITLKHSLMTLVYPALAVLERSRLFAAGRRCRSRHLQIFWRTRTGRGAELIKTGETMAHLIDALVRSSMIWSRTSDRA